MAQQVADAKLAGSCHCGSCKFTVPEAPKEILLDWCTDCQRQCGSICCTWGVIPKKDAITWDSKDLVKEYESSKDKFRLFCSKCSCVLGVRFASGPFKDVTIVTPTLLGDDWYKEGETTVKHIWCKSAPKWFKIPNDGNQRSDTFGNWYTVDKDGNKIKSNEQADA